MLFIMPHCELELYDAVLAANWDAGRLSTIAILGNSFSDYLERNPSRTRKLGKHVCLIQQCTHGAPSLARLVQCRPLPDAMACRTSEYNVVASGEHPISAFNNMSLHIFAVPEGGALPTDAGEGGPSGVHPPEELSGSVRVKSHIPRA